MDGLAFRWGRCLCFLASSTYITDIIVHLARESRWIYVVTLVHLSISAFYIPCFGGAFFISDEDRRGKLDTAEERCF